MEAAAAIEDVVEEENVASVHMGQAGVVEEYIPGTGGSLVTGDTQKIEMYWHVESPQQVCGKHEPALEDGHDRQIQAGIIGTDLSGQSIEARVNDGLVQENPSDSAASPARR